MSINMRNGMVTIYLRRLKEWFSSESPVGYSDEGQRVHRLKLCDNNNKHKDNSINSSCINLNSSKLKMKFKQEIES